MKVEIPNNFEGVELGAFMEFTSLNPNDFESGFEFRLARIAALTGEDPEAIEDSLTVEQLIDLYIQTSKFNQVPKLQTKERIEVEELGELKFKGFKSLTIGEFIDLQKLCNSGYWLNASKILAILYRRTKTGDWGEEILEPRKVFKTTERAELLESVPASDALGVIQDYLDFQDAFIKNRPSLFDSNAKEEIEEGEEEEDEEPEELDEDELKELEEEEKEEKKRIKWGWERKLYELCKGDLTKLDEVTELPLILVFNFELMKKELNIQE